MAINPLTRSSPMRAMGMASGIDTEGLIQQMMRVHQMKIDSRFRARTLFEWKHQTHTSLKDQINDLRTTFFRSTGMNALLNRTAYSSVGVEISGTNTGAVTIRAGSSSALGTLKMGQVTLAKGTHATSSGVTGPGGLGLALTDRLGNLNIFGGASIDFFDDALSPITTNTSFNTINIYRDGSGNYVYDDGSLGYVNVLGGGTGGMSLFSLADIETITVGTGASIETITLEKLADGNVREITGGMTGAATTTTYGTATINVGNSGVITLNRNMTVSDMLNAVNTSATDVTMRYDRLADTFTIESKTLGVSSPTFTYLGQALSALGFSGPAIAGNNSEVYIDGVAVDGGASNSFTYRGISITLNYDKATGGTTIGDHDITVVLKNDSTNAINNIKGAVDALNSILKRIDNLLKERKGVNEMSYTPLTDEEKSVMNEKQIEDWEAIAKKGIMKGDTGLTDLMNNLRNSIYKSVMSAKAETGYSFMSFSNGQIVLNEDMLKTALEEDSDKVANFFAGIDSSGKGTGLFYKINDSLTSYVNTRQTRTMKVLEDSIRRTNEQMDKLTLKMYAEEDKLYKQFAAMETALSSLQQQSDWFAAMMGANTR